MSEERDNHRDVVHWFQRSLHYSINGRVRADELYQCFISTQKPISQALFGKLLKKTFPNIVRTRQRHNGKVIYLHGGIGYTSTDDDKENIVDLKEIEGMAKSVHPKFFPMASDHQTVKLGFVHDTKVNDTNILSIVSVTVEPPTINLSVFKKDFDSTALGLGKHPITHQSLTAVLTTISQLNFCQGYSTSKQPTSSSLLYEKWDGGASGYVCRSVSCERIVLNATSLTNTCRVCLKQLRNFRHHASKQQHAQEAPAEEDHRDSGPAPSETRCNHRPANSNQSLGAESDDGIVLGAHLEDGDRDGMPLRTVCSENQNKLIKDLFPGLQDDSGLNELIKSQMNNLSKTERRQYRWSPRIIKLCLMLWGRSPKAYDDLKESGFLILPSSRLLRYYKNSVQQGPGINPEVLLWMRKEADRLKLTAETREGGLILDEMSMQEDLHLQNNGKLCGLADMGDDSKAIGILRKGKDETSVASHVLQLVFLGDTGFRFPFSHYPCRESTAVEMFSVIWQNIGCLRDYGFRVNYISMDGASTNRTLMKLHFRKSTVDYLRQQNFEVPNPMPPNDSIIFLMDPSHCFKKIRNNLLKSGDGSNYNRDLHINGKPLHWSAWVKAFNWDRGTNSMRIHQRLTEEHFFPDSASKMRNHLAEEVLNSDMLYLMQLAGIYINRKNAQTDGLDSSHYALWILTLRKGIEVVAGTQKFNSRWKTPCAGTDRIITMSYQRSVSADEAGKVDVVVEFLANTSSLIAILRDNRPIFSPNDERVDKLKSIHEWFLKWESLTLEKVAAEKVPKKRELLKKTLMSDQTREDLSSAILGIVQLVKNKTNRPVPGSIVPARVNTDVVENVFCQQRGLHHGNTTNPNYNAYCYGMNAILLGQSSVSRKRKSNGGLQGADPVPCQLNKALTSRSRKRKAPPRI